MGSGDSRVRVVSESFRVAAAFPMALPTASVFCFSPCPGMRLKTSSMRLMSPWAAHAAAGAARKR